MRRSTQQGRDVASRSFAEAAVVPERVFCDACGAILYDGPELESPSDVIRRYYGACPKCQKSLSYEADRVRILSYDEYLTGLKPRHKWGF
jgi:RNase P subunit RPR2